MKQQTFSISKAQTSVLTKLIDGTMIKLAVNSNELKLELVINPISSSINRNILLAMIKKKLIFADELYIIQLTALGMRMAKLAIKRNACTISSVDPTSSDVKAAIGLKLSPSEQETEQKKRAKRMYNRQVKQSYIIKAS